MDERQSRDHWSCDIAWQGERQTSKLIQLGAQGIDRGNKKDEMKMTRSKGFDLYVVY